MIKKLENLHVRYKEIEIILSNHQLDMNVNQLCNLSKEYFQLSNINSYFIKWKKINDEIKSIKTLLNDKELCGLAEQELKLVFVKKTNIEKKIKNLLLPSDSSSDSKSCFIEIRAATGGDEAAIFARDLFKMYIRYSELKFWKTEIINVTHSIKGGGLKDVIIKATGKNVYTRLKFESGGHRVQRIPQTESQGRIHTSTCTVAVIPVAPKKDVEKINSNDLKIDTFRSSGAGGQHVNTTDSAIRITHIPTGQVVECQDERSQHKNKAKALSVLVSRIQAAELSQRREIDSNTRRVLVGTGSRSDRNRTYNFPQNRVTDHRINLVIYCLDEVLNGKLDSLIEPIIQEHQVTNLSNCDDSI